VGSKRGGSSAIGCKAQALMLRKGVRWRRNDHRNENKRNSKSGHPALTAYKKEGEYIRRHPVSHKRKELKSAKRGIEVDWLAGKLIKSGKS